MSIGSAASALCLLLTTRRYRPTQGDVPDFAHASSSMLRLARLNCFAQRRPLEEVGSEDATAEKMRPRRVANHSADHKLGALVADGSFVLVLSVPARSCTLRRFRLFRFRPAARSPKCRHRNVAVDVSVTNQSTNDGGHARVRLGRSSSPARPGTSSASFARDRRC